MVQCTRDVITRSPLTMERVDWTRLLRYCAVMMSREEIEEEGLASVVPTHDNLARCTVNILVSGNDNEAKWHPAAAKPREEQKKRLVAIMVSLGVKVGMESHTFMVGTPSTTRPAVAASGSSSPWRSVVF